MKRVFAHLASSRTDGEDVSLNRRLFNSLVAIILLLHVQVAAAIQYCVREPAHDHAEMLHASHTGEAPQSETPDTPVDGESCRHMMTCGPVVIAAHRVATQGNPIVLHTETTAITAQPFSRITSPDPPPPKV